MPEEVLIHQYKAEGECNAFLHTKIGGKTLLLMRCTRLPKHKGRHQEDDGTQGSWAGSDAAGGIYHTYETWDQEDD